MNDLQMWETELDFDTRLAWLAFEIEAVNIEAPDGPEGDDAR